MLSDLTYPRLFCNHNLFNGSFPLSKRPINGPLLRSGNSGFGDGLRAEDIGTTERKVGWSFVANTFLD